MNNLTSNFSDDMSKYIVTVPALHTTAAGARITLPPVTFVFDTSNHVTVANVVAALQQYVDEHKVPHYSADEAYICKWLAEHADLEYELNYAFEHALRSMHSSCRSLGRYLSNDQGMNLSRDALNGLRLTWTKHCITELTELKDKEMTKEMNEKHNYKLLRPVKFKDLQVGDELILKDSSPVSESSVAYKANKFVVLRFSDGSEGTCHGSRLEVDYGLAPLCWVECKPVYPGDKLYRPEVEGVVALVASHITRSESGVEYLHFSNASGANEYADNRRGYLTWTKPEQKRVPSFQVEGQDVFPGDTVYYYGDDKYMWGREMIVEKDSCVNGVHAESFAKGAATFRLKPMLVIGDHLVPMPVRDAAEMKDGDCYYVPYLDTRDGYLGYTWDNHRFDIEMYDKGLVHLNKEAASAHTEAFIALSKRKPEL